MTDGTPSLPASVVIVGAGHGGFNLALALRQARYAGAITLVGDEPDLPYQRPPLSKAALAAGAQTSALWHRPADYYEKEGITLRMGARVEAIDRAHRQVDLQGGERLPYDTLVLATGARNRRLAVPGAEKSGVVYLRTAEEALKLQALMPAAQRLVVVGAGFIGLEVAAVARARGLDVTVLEREDRVLSRALSPAMSALVEEVQRGLGTELRFGAGVREIVGDEKVNGVLLQDGTLLPADLVLIGIGVEPNSELAQAAGLAVEGGILVDDRLGTSDPAIFAIGDCAVHPNPFASQPIRVESVQNATDQARLVAKRIMGETVSAYDAVPWFWSDQGPLKLQMAGLTQGHDTAIVQRGEAPGTGSVLCFRDARFLGVESANRPADHMAARQMLARGIPLSPQDVGEGFDLKAYAKEALSKAAVAPAA